MTTYFQSAANILVTQVQNSEDVLMDLDGARVVLSYDAVYELALRLARMLETYDERESSIFM